MKNQIFLLLASGILTLSLLSCEESRNVKRNQSQLESPKSSDKAESSDTNKTKIKFALILDTSNSMDGLIDYQRSSYLEVIQY